MQHRDKFIRNQAGGAKPSCCGIGKKSKSFLHNQLNVAELFLEVLLVSVKQQGANCLIGGQRVDGTQGRGRSEGIVLQAERLGMKTAVHQP